MQTHFSLAQLADPATAESNKILRACVHCGFCTATCPTYVLLGDELDSPRGRIYLIKDMLEQGRPATADVVKHVDRCLSCLACMTTCPSGVHYMHLVDHARAHVEETYRRPLARPAGALAARGGAALSGAAAGGAGARAARHGRLRRCWRALGLEAARGHAAARAGRRSAAGAAAAAQVHPAEGARKGRVALLQGCANRVLGRACECGDHPGSEPPGHRGCDARRTKACCGALVHHMGREHQALAQAKANIDLWTAEIEGEGLDAIVINVSGCGTDGEGLWLHAAHRSGLCRQGRRVSGLTRDISEYLACLAAGRAGRRLPGSPSPIMPPVRCSMASGSSVSRRSCLARHGFIVKDIPEGHLCCGSAGTYNILQSEIAQTLRDRKIANIASAESRRDRGRQYRMHHSDRVGHGDTGGPSGRVDRLGHGRPEAGGIVRRRACGAGQQGHRSAAKTSALA